MNEVNQPDRAPDKPSTVSQSGPQTRESGGGASRHSEHSDQPGHRPSVDGEAFESLPASLNPLWQRTALVSLVALFLWCIAWEIWLAPLKPGGSFMFLKALPLAFAI